MVLSCSPVWDKLLNPRVNGYTSWLFPSLNNYCTHTICYVTLTLEPAWQHCSASDVWTFAMEWPYRSTLWHIWGNSMRNRNQQCQHVRMIPLKVDRWTEPVKKNNTFGSAQMHHPESVKCLADLAFSVVMALKWECKSCKWL